MQILYYNTKNVFIAQMAMLNNDYKKVEGSQFYFIFFLLSKNKTNKNTFLHSISWSSISQVQYFMFL